jgi:hypothetical protein
MLRKFVLDPDPICKACGERLSSQVDHILPMSEGGTEYNPAGLQGICTPVDRRLPHRIQLGVPRHLPGQPVGAAGRAVLGTALISAFDSACRLYNRGVVTVEVSNQHASYLASDLVMLRAESRAALALFRPTALRR